MLIVMISMSRHKMSGQVLVCLLFEMISDDGGTNAVKSVCERLSVSRISLICYILVDGFPSNY